MPSVDAMPLDPLDYRGNVGHAAKRYRGRGIPYEDLKSLGFIAVLKALRKHKANGHRDGPFGGYATLWINAALKRATDAENERYAISGDMDMDIFPDRNADTDTDEHEAGDRAAALLSTLTDDEARAVELTLGLDGAAQRPRNLVASMMGIAHSHAGNLFARGMAKLRDHA